MILMIDNYDSFTYNLVHYLKSLGSSVMIKRNDAITLDEIQALCPQMIVLSPGPCTPKEAGICLDVVRRFAGVIPILGICLGHQTIAMAFGASVIQAPEPVHGKLSAISHTRSGLFKDLPSPLNVTRYHSLIVSRETLPDDLAVTAVTDSGLIMGLRHRHYLVEGVQFHPEAILTDQGHALLFNFLREVEDFWK